MIPDLWPPREAIAFWVCKDCGAEWPFDLNKTPHGIEWDSCIVCNHKAGDRITTKILKCPKCPILPNKSTN